MSNWKFTDANNRIVSRTLPDGRMESCVVEVIADWIAGGNTPDPADPLPPKDLVAEAKAKLAEIDLRSIRAIREYIAKQPDAPQMLKDREAEAAAERVKLK